MMFLKYIPKREIRRTLKPSLWYYPTPTRKQTKTLSWAKTFMKCGEEKMCGFEQVIHDLNGADTKTLIFTVCFDVLWKHFAK